MVPGLPWDSVWAMAFLLCSSTQALEPGCWVLNSGCAIFYLGNFRQFHNLSVLRFLPWRNGITAMRGLQRISRPSTQDASWTQCHQTMMCSLVIY